MTKFTTKKKIIINNLFEKKKKNIDVLEKVLKLAARQVLPLIHWLGY